MKNTQHPVLSKGEYSEYVLPPSELFGEVGDLFYESQENIKRATTDLINTLKQYKIPAKFSSGSYGLRLNHFILIPESGEDIELLIEKISLVRSSTPSIPGSITSRMISSGSTDSA